MCRAARQVVVIVALCQLAIVTPAAVDAQWRQRTAEERALDDRRNQGNGIVVGEPKVYDDALLQQMLNDAQAKLAALQVLDQSGLIKAFGAVTGADQRSSAFGLQLSTPALPQIVTTAKGATGSTDHTVTTKTDAAQVQTTDDVNKVIAGLPVTDVATTSPQATPPALSTALPSGAFPTSGFSVSSSDILSEQMQLTFEIANIRLLLEGALSDRIFRDPAMRRIKPRTTIGVPITIEPDKRYKNAVAIVEVEFTSAQAIVAAEKPAITAILPREKTYNVAAITDSTTSIGAGVITQVVGVSGSWLRGHKTYYLTRDQDTLGLTFQPSDAAAIGARWQFQPVLGREFVRPGLKQMFAQIALPIRGSEEEFGKIRIRSYWRKFDSRTGVLRDVVAGSLRDNAMAWGMPRYPLEVEPERFDVSSLEDLGSGRMLVRIGGRFLAGTYIRIGAAEYKIGTPGTTFDHNGIRLIVPIADLATKKAVLVARDGTELPLVIPHIRSGTPDQDEPMPTIKEATLSSFDEGRSVLTLTFASSIDHFKPEPVVVVAEKVYGYSDLPIERDARTIRAIVPTRDVLADPVVRVTSVFPHRTFGVSETVKNLSAYSQSDRLLVLEAGKDATKFLLYGHRLESAKVLVPASVTLQPIGQPSDIDNLAMVTLTAEQLKMHRSLVIERPKERPSFISIPVTEAGTPKPVLTLKERITINADEAVFVGEDLKGIASIMFDKQSLPFTVSLDGKAVTVRGLRNAKVTATTDTKSIEFTFKPATAPAKVEIVTAKVETVAK